MKDNISISGDTKNIKFDKVTNLILWYRKIAQWLLPNLVLPQ